MPRSNLTITGLDFGKADKNLAYYYGLSDFWSAIFQDSDKIELLLEASSQKLSDVYSQFLQLAATISITDIGTATNQQLKLVLIDEDAAVVGQLNTYTLPEPILKSRLIVNRPFLPTAYYEDEIHYRLSADGTTIQFFTGLSVMGFPSRTLTSGTKQYAIWFVDTLIDEQALYNYFGKLIGIAPQASTDAYKNFIFGLYYLYTNGPNLALLRKGLNLALGIPLARETETVLETRKYLETDQWLVITDSNSYLIPFGLEPTVVVGDVLNATQELAEWIEVKDFIQDGDWWINLAIPPAIMPYIPPGEVDRFAKVGSYADYLMRNFLKKHTFLINVKTIDFKNSQTFAQLSTIINEVKPSYTYPIYIWTVPVTDENIPLDDDNLTLRWDQFRCENISVPITRMKRLNAQFPFIASVDAGLLPSGNISFSCNSVNYRNGRISLPIIVESYWEVTITEINGEIAIGVGTTAIASEAPLGSTAVGYVYLNSGQKRNNNSTSAYGASYTVGDVIGVQFNPTTRVLTFYRNGVSQGTAFTASAGTYYPVFGLQGGDGAYGAFPGITGNYISTPDSVANSIVGDIDVRVRATLTDWTPLTDMALVSKDNNAAARSYVFYIKTDGTLHFSWTPDGSTNNDKASTVSTGFVDGSTQWVRVVLDVDNGAAGNDVLFYTSTDGVTWSQLGTTVTTAGITSIFNSVTQVELGGRALGASLILAGKIQYVELRSGISGTINSRFDPSQLDFGATTYTSDKSEVWTINQGAGLNKTQIQVYGKKTSLNANFGNFVFSFSVPTTATEGLYIEDINLTRGCPQFTRDTCSNFTYGQMGHDSQINARALTYEGGIISGYLNSVRPLRSNTREEDAWIRTVLTRNHGSHRVDRGKMMFIRGEPIATVEGMGVRVMSQTDSQRTILLHIVTQADLVTKYATLGLVPPPLTTWIWSLFQPDRTGTPIDSKAVDDEFINSSAATITVSSFNTFFNKGPTSYLGNFMPQLSYQSYTPLFSDVLGGDYLLFWRVYENTVGVFWVTSNSALEVPFFKVAEQTDPISIYSGDSPLKYGLAPYSTYYLLRGLGGNITTTLGNTIDSVPVDAKEFAGSSTLTKLYADDANPIAVSVTRNSTKLNFRRDFK